MNLGHFITKNVQIARAFLYSNLCWTPTIMYHSHWESSRFCIPWWLPFALKSWGSCCSRRYQSHTFWIRYRQGLLWQRRIPENLKQQQPITSLYLSSLMADAAAFWVCSNNSFEFIVGSLCEKSIGFCARTTYSNESKILTNQFRKRKRTFSLRS